MSQKVLRKEQEEVKLILSLKSLAINVMKKNVVKKIMEVFSS